MKTLSPAVITLPRRQDAAEFYFSRLSHLPWAMLLHSGYADHPYSRFDIVVAEPICTLTTFGKETVVSESENAQRPLMTRYRCSSRCWIAQTFAQRITKICHFRAAHWGCLATIWAAVLSHCQKLRNKISFCRIWQWVSTIGRSLSTTSVIQFLC